MFADHAEGPMPAFDDAMGPRGPHHHAMSPGDAMGPMPPHGPGARPEGMRGFDSHAPHKPWPLGKLHPLQIVCRHPSRPSLYNGVLCATLCAHDCVPNTCCINVHIGLTSVLQHRVVSLWLFCSRSFRSVHPYMHYQA